MAVRSTDLRSVTAVSPGKLLLQLPQVQDMILTVVRIKWAEIKHLPTASALSPSFYSGLQGPCYHPPFIDEEMKTSRDEVLSS